MGTGFLKFNLISLKYKGCKPTTVVFLTQWLRFCFDFFVRTRTSSTSNLKYYYQRNLIESEKHEIAISKPCGGGDDTTTITNKNYNDCFIGIYFLFR